MRAVLLASLGATGAVATRALLAEAGWEVLEVRPGEAFPESALVVLPDGFEPKGLEGTTPALRTALATHHGRGGHVLGLGLGFRQLCAMGFLPGAWEALETGFHHGARLFRVEHGGLVFTRGLGREVLLPVATAWRGPVLEPEERLDLELDGRVVLRDATPGGPCGGGELGAIAALVDGTDRILGLAALPERAPQAGLPFVGWCK